MDVIGVCTKEEQSINQHTSITHVRESTVRAYCKRVQCECSVSAVRVQCECSVSVCECSASAVRVQCECSASAV